MQDVAGDSDAALVAAALAGDRAAFEALLRRHYDRVRDLAWQLTGSRSDADDIAQDVCCTLVEKIGSFRAIIALVRFPLRVSSGGTSRTYRNAQSVDEDFEQIFTPRVRQAILSQRAERLRANGRDAAIGNGIVRIAQGCPNAQCSPPGPVRIVAVSP